MRISTNVLTSRKKSVKVYTSQTFKKGKAMSKMFTAISRATGEEWKSEGKHHWIMMYDSGYLVEVYDNGWDDCYIKPMLPSEWDVIYEPALKRKIERFLNKQEKEQT